MGIEWGDGYLVVMIESINDIHFHSHTSGVTVHTTQHLFS